jgi:iron complex outermembrane receptor protein
MKIQVQEIINWWICIWTIIKVESIDTQFEVTAGILTKTLEILMTVFIQFWTLLLMVPVPSRVNLQSFFCKDNISIADKYLLTLSYRRDGTSRFTEANRWANFQLH